MKKILFLSRLYFPHIGGVELHIRNVVSRMSDEYRFTLIAEQHEPHLPLYEKHDNFELWRIPIRENHSKKLEIWLWILTHLDLFWETDVIHIHDVFFWLFPFQFLFLWKKILITFHGYEGNENPTFKQKFWHRLAAVYCRANLCIGGFHSKWYGIVPTRVSFGAVGDEFLLFPSIKQNKLAKKAKIKQFLYVGRLSADTGILSYIDGLSKYSNHAWHLDVYGDGPDMESARKVIRDLKLPITLHGFVDQRKINWNLYSVALVSRYLSIFEALAIGLPVIAHANSEIKFDYLSQSPFAKWITIAKTDSQIDTALEKIFKKTKDLKKKSLKKSQEWAKAQTWERMCDNYEYLWQL